MSPWQELIAEKTRPNRTEYEVARRIEAQEQAVPPVVGKPFLAAAIVHTRGRKGVRLIPIQAMDFFNAAPPHNP